jgi:hypothetical protein
MKQPLTEKKKLYTHENQHCGNLECFESGMAGAESCEELTRLWVWMCEDQSVFNAFLTASAMFRTVFSKVWGLSESNVSYFVVLAHDIRSGAGGMAVEVKLF